MIESLLVKLIVAGTAAEQETPEGSMLRQ